MKLGDLIRLLEPFKNEILSRTDLSDKARKFLEEEFAKKKYMNVIARTSEKTLMLSNGRININEY